MAARTPEQVSKLEDEMKILFEARAELMKQQNPGWKPEQFQATFLKRIGQLYLFGSISESAFHIAEFLYGTETACTKTVYSTSSGNGRC